MYVTFRYGYSLEELAKLTRQLAACRWKLWLIPSQVRISLFYALLGRLNERREEGRAHLQLRAEMEDLSLKFFPPPKGSNGGGYYLETDLGDQFDSNDALSVVARELDEAART